MDEKKICPLLSIAQAAAGGGASPSLCLGERCAFSTRIYAGGQYLYSCAFKDMSDSLGTIAGNS